MEFWIEKKMSVVAVKFCKTWAWVLRLYTDIIDRGPLVLNYTNIIDGSVKIFRVFEFFENLF